MDEPIHTQTGSILYYNYDKTYLSKKYLGFQEIYTSIKDTYNTYVYNGESIFTTPCQYGEKQSYFEYEKNSTMKLTFPNREKLFSILEKNTCRYYVELICIDYMKKSAKKNHAILMLFDNEMKIITLIDPNHEWGFNEGVCGFFKKLFSDTCYIFLSSHEMDILKKGVNKSYKGRGHCLYYSILFSELFLSSNKDPERILLPVAQLDTNTRNAYIYKYAWHLYKNFKKYEERVVKEKQEKLKKSQEYYREYAKTVDIYANLETFLNHTIPA